MFALSTAWKARQLARGDEVVREAKACGFAALELNHNMTVMKVKQLLEQVQAGLIRVVSLHNYVPAIYRPTSRRSDPDYYSLASPDDEERRLAVKRTRETIDWAAAFGARAVVLHCGKVPIRASSRKIVELESQGEAARAEFTALRDRALAERAAAVRPFIEKLKRSLDALNHYAYWRGIALGLENRFYVREIPDLSELIELTAEFRGGAIGYWHDVGHAQCTEVLGIATQEEYLDPLGRYLIGMHLHDAYGTDDHRVPGRGTFEFRRLKPYLGRDTLRVVEAFGRATSEDLAGGRQLIAAILGD